MLISTELKVRLFPPPVNWLLVNMQKYDWPTKHRFYSWLKANFEQKLICHQVNENPFLLPIDEWCFWLEKGPDNYYLEEFVPFFQCVSEINKDVAFFDLGADIGTVSVLAKTYCRNIKQVFAFEPNPKSFRLLRENLSFMTDLAECHNLAISDFNGNVHFSRAETRSIDHEGCIDPSIKGNTQVVSIDTWLDQRQIALSQHVVIKVDVEGQEEQAIRGATRLIQQAKCVIILLEIHPQVLERTDTTPEQLFNSLENIRKTQWLVPAKGNCPVDRAKAFFEQFPKQQYDVIAICK